MKNFMKNFQQISKRRAGIIGMICLLALSLSSCLKSHNDDVVLPPAALISVINASPDSQPLDFYLDQNMANNYPIKYGNGLDYIRAYTGKRTAAFYVAGTQQKYASADIKVAADSTYSLFLSNVASKPDILLTRDTLTQPTSGMATVRFINLSADAPAADLAVTGGAVLVANKAYQSVSKFVPIAGGSKYTLEIRQAGTTTVLATLTDVSLRSGSVYTVWLQGIAASTTAPTKLAGNIQLNAFY